MRSWQSESYAGINIRIPSAGLAAYSEAASAERVIVCCYKRVGERPRGSGSACPGPGGVVG